nr:retroelement silencing factor 1 [Anolis sagrei ordinatus]
MISENIRTNNTMDWNMSSSDSNLQAKKFEFQGLPLEQQFSATHGFSQDHAPTQKICVYPGNNQTVNSPSNPMTAKKLPLHNTGATSALQPIHPSSKRPIAAKGLTPSLSLVQKTPGVIQNSFVVGTVLHGSTGNPVQTIPQQRMLPYTVLGNYNNQSPQICSNSVRTPGYRQVCKNNLSPKNPAAVQYYVNGTVSQMGAAVPLNSSPSHYLHSQQNFSCVILPVGQNNPKQINGQNSNMTGTVQSQQYASDHINPAPYNVSTYNHNRNATQISPCSVPNQVTNKNLQAPPPYSAQPIQTNYGQFPLSQPVANTSAENLQNYHNPIPNLNGTSYSAYYNQKGQISRETNTVGSTAYNISEQGSENQLSNEPKKSSVDFWENPLNNVQAARIGCADGALTLRTSQTSEPPKNLISQENLSITSSNNKPKITKESLEVDYKKLLKIEYALLKLGENYKRKCKMFLSAEQNEQAAAHNQNLNQSSPGNVTQNQPSHVANPALQFSSLDATQNQSFSPASCDSNQIKDIPLLLKNTDAHLLPVLRSLLQGTADEHMILSSYFVKDSTDQNKQLAIDGSSSGSSGKSEYNIKNPVSTPSPRAQLSQMNPTQEPLPHMKNNHAFNNFKINKDAIEALRHLFNRKPQNLVQSSATSCESSSSINKAVKENSEISHQMPPICPTLMQKSVKNINIESEHVSDASSSAVQKENHITSADSCRNGGVCSWEELKTSLALWKKSLPESLNEQTCESTQSSVGLPSAEGGKGYKMIQSLQNHTNEYIQNDQTQVTFESNGTAQTSVPISRKTHEDASSNLLKGAEPQVAIVTPLMMSKDYVQIAVQNNNPVSQNLKEIQDTSSSPSEPIKHCEDLDINRKENISSQDSGIVKVETQNSCCFELGQVRNSHSPPELKNLKSEPDSGDYFPPDNQVSQKCVLPQTISDLIEPRDNDEVVQNDTVLQISSVCSLVKGDACYNSQIASIFSTSPLTSTMENDTTLNDSVPSLQCKDQQPVILKTEPESEISISVTERNTLLPSPSTLTKAVNNALKQVPALEMDQSYKTADEMNERNYEEGKKKEKKSMPFPENKLEQNVSGSDVYISDFTSDTQELYHNKYDQLSSSVAYGLGGIGKEGTAEESKKQVPALEMDQSYKTANEMNGRNSEEDNNIESEGIPFPEKKHEQNVSGSDVHNSDFASYTQELCQNQYDQLGSSVLGGVGKDGTAEENEKQSESNTEAPVTFLSDQLAELSEEFPYGLGYLKTFSETENNDPVPKLSDPGNSGNLQSSEKFPNSSDAIDQIQIILDSQPSNKVLSEDKQHFSNKSENSESGYLKTDSEHKLPRENVSLKTDQAIDIETGVTSSETPLRREKQIYCCLQGWLASSCAMEPCTCKQVKESDSKQEVDLCLQSETTVKDRPKASENCNVDFRLNNQLSISTLDTVAKNLSSEMQCDRTLNKISGHTKAKENKPYTRDQTAPLLPSSEKLTWPKLEQTNVHPEKELLHHVPSLPLKTEMEAVEIDMRRDHVDARRNSSTAEAQHLSNTEDVNAKNLCRSDSSSKQRTEKRDVKLKTDAVRHRPIINRHKTNGERYKIKWDSSETHMIKGPISNKSLKRQKAMERKRKALAIHYNDAINDSNVSGIGSDFKKHENPQCMPTSHSQEHLNGNKFILDLGKKFGYKKAKHKEPTSSESTDRHSESTENHSESTTPKIKKVNLEKYAYSKDRQNAWKCRSSHLENSKTLTPQKQWMQPLKTSKMLSPGKEAMIDATKREKRVERSLSDKMSCFSRRTGKLSISLHREPKKTYLNRVAFKRTTHKTICLTNLEPWHSRSDWQVKSSSFSGWSQDNSKSGSSPQKPEEDKPSIQFKTCPDILFRNPVTEEQVLDEENPSEKGRTPVTAIKSKREDWIMDAPAKRKKTEENKPQVDEEIPLETAIKLLERNETFGMPLKETTYETYRKMHLEKNRSLDNSPVT